MGRKDGGSWGQRGGGVFSSRITIAVVIGITLGSLLAYVSPHGFLQSNPADTTTKPFESSGGNTDLPASSFSRVALTADDFKYSKIQEELIVLKKENERLLKKHIDMKKQIRELSNERNAARQQVLTLVPPVKAGAVGTVKSLRTHPTVEPDEEVNPDLAKLLKGVAINRELIVGVSNKNVLQMLKVWFDSIKRSGVTNFLVIALDDATAEFCKENGVPVYRRDATISSAQAGTGDNHAVSGLKFHLLREFLVLGYSVLLSDVDIVYLQDPFKHLYRDCDVESMSDGFDNITAYGYDDVSDDKSMGWARYAHTMRIWVFNSGLFFIRPTVASIELLDRVTYRLSKEKAWDQAVFNEELFYPSHPGYEGLHASRRVMDYYQFLNSKVLFKTIRKDPQNFADHKPVTIHVNYHPDKYERMLAIVDYYVMGNTKALDKFPDGSQW
ncbi:arabinosyltransferase [Marchantia polymorpha subsp. ruderalis]|uniref:Glycosyltransferase n=2 Tax=Marchantia polymorpha TaxID=3197 RepID=A0A176W3X4_MARPO|nr:hypothetical protein AXG93_2817s1160 [Marchantia polymorpha subsp. ruderalis]PTQ38558.1 hypothetical protein MARPO_0050s0027 [Marchantia polymorpha]PTQ38559.1 hypothetical protein MARPO_0050s0027 [Marchantia polymorpha]BBN05337.1 hypothetical protein Mp_3g12220 [Marchantia polymorpha subsp. ruderalis]BBN05338.1 hypothetical protein Mp_3g12220 [Marchantia polymorpha subsp. ruderalis]|eukprot:PTQ38558.1 hypothetical protein MARPO_0050s0027 [Marchantia polymorpha]